ncbi:LamG domain-containing protein [Sphingobacterium sp. SGR-19]|uniref:LamG domain-containing protein n=1 Tax=Sphingobacterium sp. SGR-19 TaxID=2710886 RepID=UPI0013EE24BF|nr:LamG domain-containing protein [Sphingobacterium sp. SGR-19]NGM64135.1 LamG domain-containing protein [Sphingobacterium sp. SGR-19]
MNDKTTYSNIVTLSHQGRAVSFVLKQAVNTNESTTSICFNILDPDIASSHDDLDWQTYQELAFPTTVSMAGFNILRIPEPTLGVTSTFRVVTDQHYIYIFRCIDNQLYANRYVLSEQPATAKNSDNNLKARANWILQPSWEVRFQRSEKPDTPLGPKDNQSFVDMDNTPFEEPVWVLPLTPTGEKVSISGFDVQLLPTATPDEYAWQIALIAEGKLFTYSIIKPAGGWFQFDDDQFDPAEQTISPNVVLSLTQPSSGTTSAAITLTGEPSACLYNKQEQVRTANNEQLKLQNAYRYMLACQGAVAAPENETAHGIVVLDFAVAETGRLAYQNTYNATQTLAAGALNTRQFTLSFNGCAQLLIPANPALTLGPTFTQQCWVMPKGTTLDKQYIFGVAPGTAAADYPPVVYITNTLKIGVGFGDGKHLLSAETKDNVLELDTWTNVIACYDETGYHLLINGSEVTLETTVDFKGKTPTPTVLTVIGQGADGGNFTGMLDEVRLWQGNQAAVAKKNLFKPLDLQEDHPDLLAYWPLNTGKGLIAKDHSKAGTHDATLSGARWVPGTPPLQLPTGDISSMDEMGLTVNTGIALPVADDDGYHLFGAIKPDSTPFLLGGKDGLIHLYYQGNNDAFLAAQYDTSISRPVFGIPWTAGPASADAVTSGNLLFIGRQAGTLLNNSVVQLTKTATNLYSLTLDDNIGNNETWQGLLQRADYVAAVLEEHYTNDPLNPDVLDSNTVFYDSLGVYKQGFLAVGDPLQHGFVQIVGTQSDGVTVDKVEVKVAEEATSATVILSGTIPGNPENPLHIQINHVPTDVTLFSQVLNDRSSTYDYTAGANNDPNNTACYQLPTDGPDGLLLVPSKEIKTTTLSITNGNSKTTCTVKISLQYSDSTKPETVGIWKNINRQLGQLSKIIKKSADGDNKIVADHIVFHCPALAQDLLVNNVAAAPTAGLRALLAFIRVFTIGANGLVGNASLPLSQIQGVKSKGYALKQRLAVKKTAPGSPLFAVRLDRSANNGYPQLLTTDKNGAATALPLKTGVNGGWLDIAPSSALGLRGKHSLVTIDNSGSQYQRLNLQQARTFEAWTYPTLSNDKLASDTNRILHLDLENGVDKSQNMLGLKRSDMLYLMGKGKLEVNDADCMDDSKRDKRLFPDQNNYAIQLYIKPALKTIEPDHPAPVLTLTFKNGETTDQIETLYLDPTGRLSYTIQTGSLDPVRSAFTQDIADSSWSQITVSRANGILSFFINGSSSGKSDTTRKPEGNNHVVTVGGNAQSTEGQLEMEMGLNQFSLYRDSLSPQFVTDHYHRVIQSSADNLQLLWRLDRQTSVGSVVNEAIVTQGLYGTSFDTEKCIWESLGVFKYAYAAVGKQAIVTEMAAVPNNQWTHLAATYQPHYGVRLNDGNYADCGANNGLNFDKAFAASLWVKADQTTKEKQVLLSKFGATEDEQSYEIGLQDGKPYLTVRCKNATDKDGNALPLNKQYITCRSTSPLTSTEMTHLVFTAELIEVTEEVENVAQNQDGEKIKQLSTSIENYHQLVLKLFVNGQFVATYPEDSASNDAILYGNVRFFDSNTPLNMGRTRPDAEVSEQAFFSGTISDVLLWNKVLGDEQLAALYTIKEIPQDGLISAWYFNEQNGRTAYDSVSSNDAVWLSNEEEMWIFVHDNATMQLLINGKLTTGINALPGDFGGYMTPQAAIGGCINDSAVVTNGFEGYLEEVRVWSERRTSEQITDNMNRHISGLKTHLVGYWAFDTGSGDRCVDESAYGNNGIFKIDTHQASPYWVPSTAPVANEGPRVRNAMGGLATDAQASLRSGPAAVEYADVQYDATGQSFSVLKRCYLYVDQDGHIVHASGYKVGDLNMVYLGQIQTNPSLIGYVEGAPPLPSENLTKPYYLDPTKPSYFAYNNSSSVALTQQKTTAFRFSGSKHTGSHLAFNTKLGGGVSFEKELEKVILITKIVKKEVIGKVTFGLGWNESEDTGSQFAAHLLSGNVNTMYNCGDWEPDDGAGMLLKNGERRFIPNNEGYALVKSATADVYTLLLQDTGALMGTTIVPNTEIPPDVNLIYFPLNRAYVKNGTLDGKVGLKNDPDYQNADVQRGSYFKPTEAYALKRQIERKDQELLAQYQQFDAKKRGKDRNYKLDNDISSNALYDWKQGAPKKGMYSTHVWTAAGGLYREQQGYVSQIEENYGGSYSFDWSLGLTAETTLVFGGAGFWGELDLNGGTHMKYEVSKAKEETSAISLDIQADPDGFLNKYLGNDPKKPFYASKSEPGKVDTYRFMTFYLPPDKGNFDDFFERVVDPRWLNLSNDPRAAALREARANTNQSWRVLHRVTYVSRIPPEYDVAPKEKVPDTDIAPANAQANTLLFELVTHHIKKLQLAAHYAPAQIGQAVKDVLDKDLVNSLPLWKTFREKASVPNSTEAKQYMTLYDDIVAYMDAYYQSIDN